MVSRAAPKLLVVTTSPVTPWGIMRGQLRYLQGHGYDVLLVSAPGEMLDATAEREGVRALSVPMEREISLRSDLRALRRLIGVIRSERPDISMVSTPKAGLLAGLAVWLTRVPTRVYVLRGLRLETTRGPQRALLWLLEWIALHVAQRVIVVSPSLLERARQLRLLGARRGVVLGAGASNGVDPARFAPTAERASASRVYRDEAGIPSDAFVFGYVGRPAVDKGIAELALAFASLANARPDVWLLMVGPQELSELPADVMPIFESTCRVTFTGWLDDPADCYHVMDALVLPTYREGFPNVPIEAAAAGRPVITTTATGAVDSIQPGVTGLLVPPRDANALLAAMRELAANPFRAKAMGEAGRGFVAEHFTNDRVWASLAEFLQHVEDPALQRKGGM